MNRQLLLSLVFIVQACAQKPWYGDLDFLGKLPANLSEVSGIVTYDGKKIWVIEDNGNKDKVYAVTPQGNLIKQFEVKNAKNRDWEDLTKDPEGNLYIGDFGNNDNDRKDLVIYKLPNPETEKGSKISADKIEFNYPEQKKFPPKKKKLVYDAEAFFHWKNHLYIITKNRTRPYTGEAFIYKIPDQKGTYDAELVASFVLCENQDHCSVTSADISSNGDKIVLLGYGYLYLITDFEFDDFSKGKIETIYLKYETQIESVCFLDENTLLIADEQSKTKGRNLYLYKLK